jgi:outer membrane protein assembly factor BamD (BamD/ComL family)
MKNHLRIFLIVTAGAALIFSCGKLPDEMYMEKGQAYEQNAEWDKAIASYEKLAKLYPRSPLRAQALYKAGLAYAHGKENYEAAVGKLESVRDEYSADPLASQCQFMIGFIYANMAADTTKAREAYTRFLQQYPNHDLKASVEWELKYLGKDINDIDELKNLGEGISGPVHKK